MTTQVIRSETVQCLDPHRNDHWVVMCNDAKGREYTIGPFRGERRAQRLVERVKEAGAITLERWHERVPYGTEAWLADGMEVLLMDDEERHHAGL